MGNPEWCLRRWPSLPEFLIPPGRGSIVEFSPDAPSNILRRDRGRERTRALLFFAAAKIVFTRKQFKSFALGTPTLYTAAAATAKLRPLVYAYAPQANYGIT